MSVEAVTQYASVSLYYRPYFSQYMSRCSHVNNPVKQPENYPNLVNQPENYPNLARYALNFHKQVFRLTACCGS